MSELGDKIIGGFRVLQEIQAGAGSQGTVYKAICEVDKFGFVEVGTVVALKVMAVQDDGGHHWRKLEKRTAELSRLDHPNVVRYYGCFVESGLFNDVHVVVQEYLDGETLKERLVRHRSGLDVDEGLKVADAALAGLEYISRVGIVHRDVKPGNIFVCSNGSVKLIDFEIARQRDGTTTSTAGNIRGSFDYMAPDFTDAEFHGDEKSDVFSMAVVIHEMLVGKTPYQRLEGEGKQANFAFLSRWSHALNEDCNPIYISSRVKRLLAHATEVLEKALAPRREARYQSFSELREALKSVKFRTLRNGNKSYQILQFIGKGGFGEVFKARLRGSDRVVAIKHLLKAAYAGRFYREAKIMKKLNSPCFVRLVDFFSMDIGNSKEAFLVMDFLDGMPGSSLRDAIRGSDGGLAVHDVLTAFERYARGLGVMHASGIFHRDIKPSNLYYPAENASLAAIMDLGIARDVNGTATHGQVPGTLDYMPPEVVLTDNRGDGGMDVYALGLCLYESLTGKTAYPRLPTGTASYTVFFERARSKATPKFTHERVLSDPELLALLKEMTDLDPDRRIRNVDEVACRIRNMLDARFGGPKSRNAAQDQPKEDSPETIDTAVVQDPSTRATLAPQWIGMKEIKRERNRRLVKRVLLPLVFILLVAAPTLYFAWSPAKGIVSRFKQEAEEVSVFRKLIRSCILEDGFLHDGNYAELDKMMIPQNQSVLSSLSADVNRLGKALSGSIRANLKVEPPLTRRIRIKRAKQLLNSRWAALALYSGESTLLKQEIETAESWCVSIVKNGCANSIWVDGSEIPVGGSKVMVYEDGHPEIGIVSRPGFNPMHLPKDIDGRVHEVAEDSFTAKPVRFSMPMFEAGVRCELNGRIRSPGEIVELMPGYYECLYHRDTYKTQVATFSIYPNAEVKVPVPSVWVHTEEYAERERQRKEAEAKRLAAEQKLKEEELRQKAELERRNAEVARRKAEELERQRAEEARRRAEELERQRAEEARRKAEELRLRTPVSVRLSPLGNGVVCLFDGKEVTADFKLKPGRYSCVYRRVGYMDQKRFFAVEPDVGCTLPPPDVWQACPVKVTMPDLAKNVVCHVDGMEVGSALTLLPGEHKCVYSRLDYEDQSSVFTVHPATPVLLPVPQTWVASSGLQRLKEAEAALKEGDLPRAEMLVSLAEVVADENRLKRQSLADRIAKQVKTAEMREQAMLYFEEGLFYDAAKSFFEAAESGCALTQEDLGKFGVSYEKSKKRLQVMIDRCHKDIALGKSPIRPLADLESEMRRLIDWNARIKGRRFDIGR